MTSIYDFTCKSSDGQDIHLADYKGKVVLFVNTATKCGLASQFAELETLYQTYKEKGFVVIGFPSDQFMHQEPETNETMAQVCLINFGVTFPLSEKIEVNGPGTHPLFVYLKKELKGGLFGLFGEAVKWNFTKFLVDKNGGPYKRYSPTTLPSAMTGDIEKLLA